MSKVNGLFQDERNAAGEKLIADGLSPEDAHERLSTAPTTPVPVEASEWRATLEEIESWLYGGTLASPEDFAQGIPHMTEIVRKALAASPPPPVQGVEAEELAAIEALRLDFAAWSVLNDGSHWPPNNVRALFTLLTRLSPSGREIAAAEGREKGMKMVIRQLEAMLAARDERIKAAYVAGYTEATGRNQWDGFEESAALHADDYTRALLTPNTNGAEG